MSIQPSLSKSRKAQPGPSVSGRYRLSDMALSCCHSRPLANGGISSNSGGVKSSAAGKRSSPHAPKARPKRNRSLLDGCIANLLQDERDGFVGCFSALLDDKPNAVVP